MKRLILLIAFATNPTLMNSMEPLEEDRTSVDAAQMAAEFSELEQQIATQFTIPEKDYSSQTHITSEFKKIEAQIEDYFEKLEQNSATQYGTQIRTPQEKNNQKLNSAIATGDIETIKRMLNENADINAKTDGFTPLMAAVHHGHALLCDELIMHGAQLNEKNDSGKTALDIAISSNEEACMMLLLEAGAIGSEPDNTEETLIQREKTGTQENPINQHSPALNITNNNNENQTPANTAHIAAEFNELEGEIATQFALPVNNNPINNNNNAEAPSSNKGLVFFAIDKENICKKIWGTTCLNKPKNGLLPLMQATLNGDLYGVDYLIRYGANVNVPDADDCTPLMAAAQNGNDTICRYLIARNAKIDLQDRSGNTALIIAALFGHIGTCQLLVDADADINLKDHNGFTALEAAKLHSHQEIYDFLSNFRDKKMGITPLIRATINGDRYLCQKLLRNSYPINALDNNRMTALMHATDSEIGKILLKHGAQINIEDTNKMTPLMWAARNGLWELCELFVQAKAPVSQQDKNNDTASIHAAKSGHKALSRYLTNAAFKAGKNEFALFATKGSCTQCQLILDCALNKKELVNRSNSLGITPLMNAAKQSDVKMLQFLLRAGALTNLRDHQGHTALCHAKIAGADSNISGILTIYENESLKSRIFRKIIEANEDEQSKIFDNKLTDIHLSMLPQHLFEINNT